jgi:hypothetical protein
MNLNLTFELNRVVPWGRNLAEYTKIFDLTDNELNSKIISFGDGPASFNAEMTQLNNTVISIDPIYQFSKNELSDRIKETKDIVLEQTKNNFEKFVWKNIRDIGHLEEIRMTAMYNFLDDFEIGKLQNRYQYHELPNKTKFDESTFDLGLSSHFLILYSQLGLEFHIQSITEMLRICKEVRIFPILNLNAEKSEVLDDIINFFSDEFEVQIKSSNYEFQKNGNQMLVIKKQIKA